MFVPYLNYSTCQKINATLNLSWDPNSTSINPASDYEYNVFYPGAGDVRTAPNFVAGGGPGGGHSSAGEACAYDYNSNSHNSAYVFMCAVMVR
jgi:hypothetical protein